MKNTKMEIGRRIFLLSFLLYFVLFMARSAASQSTATTTTTFLGISPEDELYYKALSNNNAIKCKDGSKIFHKSQLNDDFCDCPDGSDEPGTSACPTGKFYCPNAGHTPLTLYSSRVNDGICDCCDGSDEYDGKVKCPNTCWEAGKVARDKLKKKIATYQEGVSIRKRDVEQAKEAIAKDEAELSKLESEEKVLKGLVEQLKERKEQIEKAEEKERMQKEKEERERREAEEAKSRETEASEKADVPEESNAVNSADTPPEEPMDSSIHDKVEDSPMDVAEDHHKSVDETKHSDNSINDGSPESIEQHTNMKEEEHAVGDESGLNAGSKSEDAENTESLSSEELGRRVASQWVRQESVKEAEDVGAKADDLETHEELPADAHDDEYNGYNSEDSYEDDDVDDNDHPEDPVEDFNEEDHSGSRTSYKSESDDESDLSGTEASSTGNPSWLEKIQQTVRSVLQAVNIFQAPVNISEAAHVRKEYEESNDKLTKIQSRISKLTKKLKHDFGPEKEFYSFYGQCFESKQNKYVYKICPFKETTQEEGHSRTRLGSWDKFDDNYKIMQFSNGDKCWNGPDRSLKVKLRCGLRNEVSDVDEPSRCEYLALLSTPALCLEDKLQELQDKLDLMNKEQPQNHDEL